MNGRTFDDVRREQRRRIETTVRHFFHFQIEIQSDRSERNERNERIFLSRLTSQSLSLWSDNSNRHHYPTSISCSFTVERHFFNGYGNERNSESSFSSVLFLFSLLTMKKNVSFRILSINKGEREREKRRIESVWNGNIDNSSNRRLNDTCWPAN